MKLNSTPAELSKRTEFDVELHLRLIFGAGSIGRVGQLARELGGKRVLIVTDAGIVKAGHAGKVIGC